MSDLLPERCRCGALAYRSPASTTAPRCMDCHGADAGVTPGAGVPIGAWHLTVGYSSPGLSDVLAPTVAPEAYPAPEVTSRDGWQPGINAPAVVLKLAEFARGASWEVVTQYSRGREPHGTTGRPGALKDYIGLRIGGHPVTRRQAYVITSRTVGREAWTWDSVQIWGPDLPAFAGCGVTELKTFLETTAMLPIGDVEEWVRGIAGRRAEQACAAKERAASRPKPSSKRETS